MDTTTIVILSLFGIAIGSFLNVLIFRFDPEKGLKVSNLKGRSKCVKCRNKLSWFELVPVFSFVFQKGKCRNCGEKISWQYPIVELLAGAIFVFLPLFFFNFYQVDFFGFESVYLYLLIGLWILIFLSWLVITFIDLKHYIIPDEINLFIGLLGVFVILSKLNINDLALPFHDSFLKYYSLVFSPFDSVIINHAFGAVVAGLFLALIAILTNGRALGWGDVKLIFFSGIALGWPDVGLSLVITFLLGGLFGGYLLITKRKNMKDKVPFAPFIVTGMVLTVFFGHSIIQGYFNFLGV